MFARDHMDPLETTIWCSCYRCNNHVQKIIDEVEIHLYTYGMVMSYTRWVYHGEDFEVNGNDNDDDDIHDENDEYPDDDIQIGRAHV